MAEHSAVNRRVVSSSLTCGANFYNKLARQRLTGFYYLPTKLPNASEDYLRDPDRTRDQLLGQKL
jgi:hypothetical protein